MELKREEMGDEDFEQWREMQAKLDRISAASRQKDQGPQAEGFTVTGMAVRSSIRPPRTLSKGTMSSHRIY